MYSQKIVKISEKCVTVGHFLGAFLLVLNTIYPTLTTIKRGKFQLEPIYFVEFRLDMPPKQRSSEDLRTIETYPKMYRCLEILLAILNETMSIVLLPLQTSWIYINMYSAVVLYRFSDELPFVAKTMLITFATGVTLL